MRQVLGGWTLRKRSYMAVDSFRLSRWDLAAVIVAACVVAALVGFSGGWFSAVHSQELVLPEKVIENFNPPHVSLLLFDAGHVDNFDKIRLTLYPEDTVRRFNLFFYDENGRLWYATWENAAGLVENDGSMALLPPDNYGLWV